MGGDNFQHLEGQIADCRNYFAPGKDSTIARSCCKELIK